MELSTVTAITVHGLSTDRAAVLSLIQTANVKDTTRQKYVKVLGDYLAYGNITDPDALANYANQLTPSTARHLQAAVSKWTSKAKKQLRNMVTPDNLATIQAMMYRLDGIGESIEVKTIKGEKAHIWLSPVEQDKLLELASHHDRDAVLIRLLLATGLRRNEAANVRFEDVINMGSVPVLQIIGKRSKRRQVPIGVKFADFLDNWRLRIASVADGYILRSVSQAGKVGSSLSGVSIYRIVNKYGQLINKPTLAPHDLRRTFAENLRRNGADIVTISNQLGHDSIETTKRYLNVNVDLSIVGADFLTW